MKKQLADAADRLVEQAVREMIKTAMKLVVRSEVGIATTTMMVPYLDKMILFNKALEALMDAIRMWKAAQRAFLPI